VAFSLTVEPDNECSEARTSVSVNLCNRKPAAIGLWYSSSRKAKHIAPCGSATLHRDITSEKFATLKHAQVMRPPGWKKGGTPVRGGHGVIDVHNRIHAGRVCYCTAAPVKVGVRSDIAWSLTCAPPWLRLRRAVIFYGIRFCCLSRSKSTAVWRGIMDFWRVASWSSFRVVLAGQLWMRQDSFPKNGPCRVLYLSPIDDSQLKPLGCVIGANSTIQGKPRTDDQLNKKRSLIWKNQSS